LRELYSYVLFPCNIYLPLFLVVQFLPQLLHREARRDTSIVSINQHTTKIAMAKDVHTGLLPVLVTLLAMGFSMAQRVCKVTDTNSCDLTKARRVETTLIYPGGESRCLSTDEYAFQVRMHGAHVLELY